MSSLLADPGDARGFDFLHGEWTVRHQRLRSPLTGSTDWYETTGTCRCWPILDGFGNVDEFAFPDEGWSGATFRVFDRARGDWALYWASSRDGMLQPPVRGGFGAERGVFSGEDTFDGRPIRVRYIWDRIEQDSCRWQQAFALPGGEWETNWVMELTRVTAPS